MKRFIRVGDFKIGVQQRTMIQKILASGRISEGPVTSEFEKEWARYIGTKYCVATSSGSGALITALTAIKYLYGFKPGTKAIVTPLTYIATVSALTVTGYDPVFVDIDPLDLCITPENVERKLRESKHPERFGLILPVDLLGYPVRITDFKKIAKKYNLVVLEDAAEAHGSIYKGQRAGSMADAGIFSFYIAHNIQAGELGCVTTNNKDIFRLSKKIKAQGRVCDCLVCTRTKGYCPHMNAGSDLDPRFAHDLIGYNFKTMEFQTGLALTQIKRADDIMKKRQENVSFLNAYLKKFESILQLPRFSSNVSYLSYPIVIKSPGLISRKYICSELEKRGIETRILFGCIPTQQTAYQSLKREYEGSLPNAEYAGRNGFYLGCHQYLTRADLKYILTCFDAILEKFL